MLLYPIKVPGRNALRAFYRQPKQLSGSLASNLNQSDVLYYVLVLSQAIHQEQGRVNSS